MGRRCFGWRERWVKLVGVTAHSATDVVGEGPIIAQGVIHRNHRDTLTIWRARGRDVERRVLADAARLHLEDRALVSENTTIVF